ncbi:MAG TPA: hypothetical protein PLZ57_15380 [Pseudobdellovibrionaceae bacterium]|nr:hypothetical protein [Pseudobdellovibrionaceae bacterium]
MASKNQKRSELFFLTLILVLLTSFTINAFAEEAKIIRLDEKTIGKVLISTRGTVLSFPIKPTKVILGRAGTFGIEYVESDLAISPLNTAARSNLFVYLYGRRFSFDLVTSPQGGSPVIRVLDAIEPKPAVSPPPAKAKGKK